MLNLAHVLGQRSFGDLQGVTLTLLLLWLAEHWRGSTAMFEADAVPSRIDGRDV